MTKFIVIAVLAAILYAGWHFYFYWERVKNEEEHEKKKAAAQLVVGVTFR